MYVIFIEISCCFLRLETRLEIVDKLKQILPLLIFTTIHLLEAEVHADRPGNRRDKDNSRF
jgi:hypothetical protein